ncbi:LCP family glycopolymer transferase [Corynebacterium falsenii]|uniref:LCP family glycopolymer transferase n=1 Tax=Corynebacterium falsenii TaxID=108486 RepID=UPI003FD433DD
MDSRDDVARDRNGKPILDRFGRPVRRRPLPPSSKGTGTGTGAGTGAAGSDERPRGRHAAPDGERPEWLERRLRDQPRAWDNSRERGAHSAGGAHARHSADRPDRADRADRGDRSDRAARDPRYGGYGRNGRDTDSPRRREGVVPAPPRYPRHEQHDREQPYAPNRGDYRRRAAEAAGVAGAGTAGAAARAASVGAYPPPRPNAPERMEGWQAPEQRPGRYSRRSAPVARGEARPKRRRMKIGRILAAVLVVIVALTVGTGVWINSKLQRTDAIQNYDGRLGNTSGTNWLLVGSDSRAGLTEEDANRLMAGELDDTVGRTDTIMLVHLPTFGGQATMLSIPRDSYVDIPGYGTSKINESFSLGGPALLQRTVEQATGIHIDHYAEIGFGGFANVVDAVGGIEICVQEPLDDPMAGINLQPGCQKMNGPTALGYVRSRYASANGDLDRVQRQRQFLTALSDKIASPGTLLNPFRAVKVIDTVTASLTVDNSDNVLNLARLAWGIRGAKQETVPTSGTEDTDAGNVLLWDDGAAEQLFQSLR